MFVADCRKSLKSRSTKKLGMKQVSSSQEPGVSYISVVDAVSVINYYVEIEHENELARRHAVTPPPRPPSDSGEELPHNTIVSLPKINT